MHTNILSLRMYSYYIKLWRIKWLVWESVRVHVSHEWSQKQLLQGFQSMGKLYRMSSVRGKTARSQEHWSLKPKVLVGLIIETSINVFFISASLLTNQAMQVLFLFIACRFLSSLCGWSIILHFHYKSPKMVAQKYLFWFCSSLIE